MNLVMTQYVKNNSTRCEDDFAESSHPYRIFAMGMLLDLQVTVPINAYLDCETIYHTPNDAEPTFQEAWRQLDAGAVHGAMKSWLSACYDGFSGAVRLIDLKYEIQMKFASM
jgi:hypothetical protein